MLGEEKNYKNCTRLTLLLGTKAQESALLRNLVFYLEMVSLEPFVPPEYGLGTSEAQLCFWRTKSVAARVIKVHLNGGGFLGGREEKLGEFFRFLFSFVLFFSGEVVPGGGEYQFFSIRFFRPGIHRCLLLQNGLWSRTRFPAREL